MTAGGEKKKEMQDFYCVHESNMQFNVYPIICSSCLSQLVTREINYRFYDQGVYLSDAN